MQRRDSNRFSIASCIYPKIGPTTPRAEKKQLPEEVESHTKPQIALKRVDRALANGVCVAAWTFDALYGRDNKFLGGLQERGQVFVADVPVDFHGWL